MNQKNPFGEFYDIPTNAQTVMTLINQFWLEKNKKTDWVIAFTLAALYQKKVHIVPNFSFIRNIGFGHPEAKTYWGKEQDWVNARYDKDFCPNKLPTSLDRPEAIARPLSGTELLQHLMLSRAMWLSPSAFLYFLKQSTSMAGIVLAVKSFISRLPILLGRWRSGLSM
ncbi:MAG: hypothetical protein F6K09_10375 [Merismopedia sp. SIO2A8]|nr:hypothetical protein [Merismopedia sp. SIO2A8]